MIIKFGKVLLDEEIMYEMIKKYGTKVVYNIRDFYYPKYLDDFPQKDISFDDYLGEYVGWGEVANEFLCIYCEDEFNCSFWEEFIKMKDGDGQVFDRIFDDARDYYKNVIKFDF